MKRAGVTPLKWRHRDYRCSRRVCTRPHAPRVAAIVALVTSVVLVLYVLAVLFGHCVDLLFGLIGVSVAVAGGWWLVTKRMPRRFFGIIGVVVGLVALGVIIARERSTVPIASPFES